MDPAVSHNTTNLIRIFTYPLSTSVHRTFKLSRYATMMMIKSALVLATLAASAYGQSVTIAAPAAGTTLTAGQTFTVDVAQPVRLLQTSPLP